MIDCKCGTHLNKAKSTLSVSTDSANIVRPQRLRGTSMVDLVGLRRTLEARFKELSTFYNWTFFLHTGKY